MAVIIATGAHCGNRRTFRKMAGPDAAQSTSDSHLGGICGSEKRPCGFFPERPHLMQDENRSKNWMSDESGRGSHLMMGKA
jgi:hypothetical protein